MLLHNSVNVPLGATVGLKNLHITLNALSALMHPPPSQSTTPSTFIVGLNKSSVVSAVLVLFILT